MRNKLEVNRLLDFYEALLTEKQKHIMSDYFREDYSLQEIAENEGISRAAVHDTIKRASEELAAYEDKLHLVQQFLRRDEIYQKIAKEGNNTVKKLIEQCYDIEDNEE